MTVSLPQAVSQPHMARMVDQIEQSLHAMLQQRSATCAATAHGEVHALLLELATFSLTSEQVEQVQRIIDLHLQCCYPLEY